MPVKRVITFILLFIFFFVQDKGAQELSCVEHISLIKGKSYLLTLEEEVKEKGRVKIRDPKIADVEVISPRQILLNGKKLGTTILIIEPNERKTVAYDISVNLDVDEIKEKLKRIVPEAQIDVKAAAEGIVIAGEVEDIEMMEKVLGVVRRCSEKKENIVNLLKVKGAQQVQLKVRIAEVSRAGLRRSGINLFYSGSSRWVLGIFQPQSTVLPDTVDTGELVKGGGVVMGSPFREGFQVLFKSLKTDLTGILGLLEREGFAKVLAEPTLVAMSGQEASFLVGGEIPIPIPYYEEMVTIEFREFGIRLRFTPTVIGKETISLKVAPEVSEIDPSLQVAYAGFIIPGFTTRRAETTIQLKDGQTFAIAGLLKDTMRSSVNKFPILGNIPILGAFFRNVEFEREETELLILVTPHLAKPMVAEEVPPLPGEGLCPPSDFELFLIGKMAHWEKISIPKEGGPAGEFGFMR